LTCLGLNLNPGSFGGSTLLSVLCGETRLVVRPGAEDRDGQTQVRYSVVGRSSGGVMLCAVYTVHKEMRSTSFLVQPQNQGRRNPSGRVPSFMPQNGRFGLVIWPQNHRCGLSVAS
jgi:hypothetical protein